MNKLCKLFYISVLCLYSSVSFAIDEESSILLGRILQPDAQLSHSEQLEGYKRWGEVYEDYYQKLKSDKATQRDINIYLFLVFTAIEKEAVSFEEDIAETSINFLMMYPCLFVKGIIANPFMADSFCKSLDGYYELFEEAGDSQKNTGVSLFLKRLKKAGISTNSCVLLGDMMKEISR